MFFDILSGKSFAVGIVNIFKKRSLPCLPQGKKSKKRKIMQKNLFGAGVALVAVVAILVLFQWKGKDVVAEIHPPTCPDLVFERDYISNEVLPKLKSITSDDTPDWIFGYHPSFVDNKVAIIGADIVGNDQNNYPIPGIRSIWVVDIVENRWTQVTPGVEFNDADVIMLPNGYLLAVRTELFHARIADLYLLRPPYGPRDGERITFGEDFYGLAKSSSKDTLVFLSRDNKIWEHQIDDSLWDFKPSGKCE